MRRLICAFVVCIWHKQVFSCHGSCVNVLSVSVNVFTGAQIVLSMKILGIAFGLSNGNMIEFPSIFAYFGYNLCIGAVIFGPWFHFKFTLVDGNNS